MIDLSELREDEDVKGGGETTAIMPPPPSATESAIIPMEEVIEAEDKQEYLEHHHYHHYLAQDETLVTMSPSKAVLIVYGFESLLWLAFLCAGVYMDIQVEHITCTLEQKHFARFTVCLMSYLFLMSSFVFSTAGLKKVCIKSAVGDSHENEEEEEKEEEDVLFEAPQPAPYVVRVPEGGLSLDVQGSVNNFIDDLVRNDRLADFLAKHANTGGEVDTVHPSALQPLLKMGEQEQSRSPPPPTTPRPPKNSNLKELCNVVGMLRSVALLSFLIYVYMGVHSALSDSYSKEDTCKDSFLFSWVNVVVVLAQLLVQTLPRLLS